MLLCPAVPRLMTSEFPIRSSAGCQEKGGEKTHCTKSAITAGPGIGCVSDVKARDSQFHPGTELIKQKKT